MKVRHMVVHRGLFLLINLNENRTQFFKVNGSLVLKNCTESKLKNNFDSKKDQEMHLDHLHLKLVFLLVTSKLVLKAIRHKYVHISCTIQMLNKLITSNPSLPRYPAYNL